MATKGPYAVALAAASQAASVDAATKPADKKYGLVTKTFEVHTARPSA